MVDANNAQPNSCPDITSSTIFTKAPWVATTGSETAEFCVGVAIALKQVSELRSLPSPTDSETSTLELPQDPETLSLAAEIVGLKSS